MAKNNGTIKRVTRKRSSAPKTARKPRLAEEAVAELQGARMDDIAHIEAEAEATTTAAAVDAPVEAPVAESAPVAEDDAPVEDVVVPAEEPAAAATPELLEVLEVAPPRAAETNEIKVVEAPPPPRAVSVWPTPPAEESKGKGRMETTRPDRRFRRIAFVRAMLHRLRREAEKRSAPYVRRVAARFPRLVALRDSIRRWF